MGGYVTHPPPGEGRVWVDKPVDGSASSQTAIEGFGGALHKRVACLPKNFVEAVVTTKTCKMQANYLPVIKNIVCIFLFSLELFCHFSNTSFFVLLLFSFSKTESIAKCGHCTTTNSF